VEGDTLTGFVADLTQAQLDGFFEADDPHAPAAGLLRGATTRIVYDVNRFLRTKQAHPDDSAKWQPACAATLARETHVSAPLPPQGLRIQLSFSYSDGFDREVQKKIQAEPGPLVEGGPVGSPRWVGSGWTIFNNKGRPVRRYEPFFSIRRRSDGTLFSDHRFEFGVMAGVSPVLFYDPAGRVIATLHPNHTYEKVVFDPWQRTTYDVNDTCAPRNQQTGDPRTDPDIQGYVPKYFKTQAATWQPWHARRIGGAMGTHEQNAAQRAAVHADTPTAANFDALGRPFLTVARNRVVCPGHDLDGAEDSFATRVELDIEGNQRAVRDERKLPVNHLPTGAIEARTVIRYAYDMIGNRIYQLSMEAGARWMLNDVTGKPIRAWDSRGHNSTTTYDALRRPIEQSVRGTSADSDPRTLNRDALVDRIEYGEPPPNATDAQDREAQRLNLRTRIYRHSDSGGMTINARLDASGNPTEAYDFKGNLLRSTRRLVSDYKSVPDWLLNPRLENENFEGGTRYDALNRPIQSIVPHSNLSRAKHNVVQPVFNEANLLERVDVWLERAAEPDALLDPNTEQASSVGLASIDYDAKGQRLRIDYKNGATTRYRYDPETFRLVHLYTRRGAAFTDDCDNPAPPPPTIAAPDTPAQGTACGLQNLHYSYDPSGNITHIRDDAQQTIYFNNQRVEPSNDYVYDAIYRLIQATGREHLGQGGAPIVHSHNDEGRVGLVSADTAGRFAPNDGNAMGTYTERYVYDAVGNFLKMQHARSDVAASGWTRRYTYNEISLIEGGKQSNRLSSTQVGNGVAAVPEAYLHDAHGNMVRMPHLGGALPEPNIHWDYKDQMRQTDLGGGGTTFYVYDASGQRVRKVWEKAPGLTEERIYLGGSEVFRRHDGPIGANTIRLERETLHVMDDKQRIALVETRTLDVAGDDQAPRQLIRYQYGNHLGSVSLELDERAQIVSYEEYAPYGSTTYQAVRSQTETPKRRRYTAKERDEESGLYYCGARYCAAWLGRWTSCDPARLVEGANLYEVVSDNPIRCVDPDGRQSAANDQDPTNPNNFVSLEGYRIANPSQPEDVVRNVWDAARSTRHGNTLARQLSANEEHGSTASGSLIAPPADDETRFKSLLKSQLHLRDQDVSSARNFLIDKYEDLARQSPEGYPNSIYAEVLPPSATASNYHAAATHTARDSINNRTRWALQSLLLQYGIEYGYTEMATRAEHSTEFSYQIHKQAFQFSNDVATIGRFPWALLTHVDIPRVGENIGDVLYFPEAFWAGTVAGFNQLALNPLATDSADAAYDAAYSRTIAQKYSLGGRIINWTIEETNSPHGYSSLTWHGKIFRAWLDLESHAAYPFFD
jgi:RHS repeat-associated protein